MKIKIHLDLTIMILWRMPKLMNNLIKEHSHKLEFNHMLKKLQMSMMQSQDLRNLLVMPKIQTGKLNLLTLLLSFKTQFIA